jgi:hypothetical protein
MQFIPVLLGEFDPSILALGVPMLALMIPIVVLLTKHQQRMTELLHGGTNAAEVEALRQEVAELKSLVQQQSFAINRVMATAPIVDTTRINSV